MEIRNISLKIWIDTSKRKFTCCEDAEVLLKEITQLIESKGYNIPEEFCGKNPCIGIYKE